MRSTYSVIRKFLSYAVLVVVLGASPLTVFADDSTANGSTPTAPAPNYTYDPATNHWNTDDWVYDPVSGTYVPNVQPPVPPTITAPVAPDITAPTPPATPTSTTDTTAGTTTQSNTNVTNNATGASTSGDATVQANTSAGDATSGNSMSSATLLNAVNSVLSANGTKPVTFTSDIYGDVHGDIDISPQILSALANAGSNTSTPQNMSYDVTQKTSLTNNVDLNALSGKASVLDNTAAGDATSGNATAIANIINIVNSVIAANKSFVGTINIHGNLDGDILMSQSGAPQLLGTNVSAPLSPGQLFVNQNNVANVLNNVNLSADTGAANVNNNTSAGNATTGTAKTNLVVYNLTGHQVVAKDSLLVFVNVMGKWVGIIVNAPTGATAAVLGDDVASSLFAAPDTMDINSNNATEITNNVNVHAGSGDATVAGNTSAGNATSGDATAGVNILNVANSAFSLSGWFGVLFINVFGTWDGSFGVDTASGNTPPPVASASTPPPATSAAVPAVFSFIPRAFNPQQSSSSQSSGDPDVNNSNGQVLSTSTDSDGPTTPTAHAQAVSATPATPQFNVPVVVVVSAGLLIGIYLAIRAVVLMRRQYTGVV